MSSMAYASPGGSLGDNLTQLFRGPAGSYSELRLAPVVVRTAAVAATPPPWMRLPIVAQILNYRDREHLLRMAQSSTSIKVANATGSLFPEYTQEVQQRRASY
ncbi:hypothetical protein NDU88_006473 [Pleurodeles waltl]|uniref:F-box domain-containing protein n=1 Tax=Pleurodeles waltl TaxID=8319 RepID=A0AAV7TFM3_PLEWA|nr:hypothetical protein NDU88_006473 [Pleurodeles waltl]